MRTTGGRPYDEDRYASREMGSDSEVFGLSDTRVMVLPTNSIKTRQRFPQSSTVNCQLTTDKKAPLRYAERRALQDRLPITAIVENTDNMYREFFFIY